MPLRAEPVKFREFSVVGHHIVLDANPRGFVIAIDDRRFTVGERAQRAFAATVVLLFHVVLMMALTVTARPDMKFKDDDRDLIQAELDEPVPPPVPERVIPLQLVPHPVTPPEPQPQPKTQVQPEPQPQKQAAVAPIPAPPVPQPTPVPDKPQPKVVNRPQDTFDMPRQPVLQAQSDVKLQNNQVAAPTVEPELQAANTRLKKKQEEELEARQAAPAVVSNFGDIKLHEAPTTGIQTVVAPSGLTPDGTHLATGAPQAGGGAAGASGGKTGTGIKGGRGGLTQALQNDDFCLKAQRDGKPIPADCHMKGLTEMAALSMKLDPHLQKEADAHAFQQKYKTTPGNDAYWKRNSVNSRPGSQLGDEDDQAGAYTDPKDQRVLTGTDPDPRNSIHKTAH
jgi:hypothetical protein